MAVILGVQRTDWYFDFWALDDHHIVALARGPICDAIPTYKEAAALSSEYIQPRPICEFLVEQKSIQSLKP